MNLTERFVKEGLELAKGCTLYGVYFDQMTREELIAAAAQGWNEERRQRENYAETAEARATWFVEQVRRKHIGFKSFP